MEQSPPNQTNHGQTLSKQEDTTNPQTDPASVCQTPVGLQTQREEAQGAGGAKKS